MNDFVVDLVDVMQFALCSDLVVVEVAVVVVVEVVVVVVVSLVNLFLKLILMVSFLMIIFLVYLPKLFSILVNHFHEIFNSCLNFFRGFYISKVCTVVLFKLISFFSISCCLDKVSTGFAAPNGFDLGLEEVLADEIGVTKGFSAGALLGTAGWFVGWIC